MADHPTVLQILEEMADVGHDADMCRIIREKDAEKDKDAGSRLGEAIISLIQQRYADHKADQN